MRVLVVAPHADDESLGCGGTLLKHKQRGDCTAWLLLTCALAEHGYSESEERIESEQIERVREGFGFDELFNLKLPPAQLDRIAKRDLATAVGRAVRDFGADCLYLPHPGDAHSDHLLAFEAASSATKWFRYPGVQRVATYETVSETEFGLSPNHAAFRPNYFVDISSHLERKLQLLSIYGTEMGEFPFPRSAQHVVSLARVRGAAAGFQAAEAFTILKDVW